MKAVETALGVEVHFTHGLGMVTRVSEFGRQRGRILEWVGARHRETAVVPLVHPREDTGAGGRAGRDGGVGVVEARPALRQLIQIRGFQYRMAVASKAVAALLVGCNEKQVRSGGHTVAG